MADDPYHTLVETHASPPVVAPLVAAELLMLPELPGFEVLGVLGRGGMGVVYKARHLGLNRLVAVKMIRSFDSGDSDAQRRFTLEAEAVARLRHPNIVQIFEVGHHHGLPYFVLEFVEGGSLDRRLSGSPLSPREAGELLECLARAMHHAHERGIVHRDLKPANILLEKTGDGTLVPRVTDFGLAKVANEGGQQTETGSVFGTPHYMAPEQAAGRVKEVGPAADIYALGVILYQLMTGRPPFRAKSPLELLNQLMTQEPIPPRKLQTNVPADLETICLKCLQKEPSRRYASSLDLADDLRRFLNAEPIAARPVGRVERGVKWARRRPALASLLGVSLTATVALAVLGTRYFLDLRSANIAISHEKDVATKAEKDAKAALEKSRRNLFALQLSFVGATHESDPVRAMQMLHDAELCPEDLRDFMWSLFRERCQRDRLAWSAHGTSVRALAFTSDGKQLISASADGAIKFWNSATGASIRVQSAPVDAISVAVNPDSGLVAFAPRDGGKTELWDITTEKKTASLASDAEMDGTALSAVALSGKGIRAAAVGASGIRVWDVFDKAPRPLGAAAKGVITAISFSADGKSLAMCDSDGNVQWLDADSGTLRGKAEAHRIILLGVAFSRDGMFVAAGGQDGIVRVWETATGRETLRLAGHSGPAWSVAFSPDGKGLAVGCQDGSIKLWALRPSDGEVVIPGPTSAVQGLAFAPDGSRLAVSGKQGRIELHDLSTHFNGNLANQSPQASLHERKSTSLIGHKASVTSLAFAPDGQLLASASGDGTARLWDLYGGREPLVLTGHNKAVLAVAFSPKGRLLATGGQEGTVRLWDAESGRSEGIFDATGGVVWHIAFSPDGQSLAAAHANGVVHIWSVRRGQKLTTFKTHLSSVNAVAFSPDGTRLAAGGQNKEVEIWELETEKVQYVLRGHTKAVTAVAFSPDGKLLFSASSDGAIRLWDPIHGQLRLVLTGHPDRVVAMSFAPTGDILAASGPGQLRIWKPGPR